MNLKKLIFYASKPNVSFEVENLLLKISMLQRSIIESEIDLSDGSVLINVAGNGEDGEATNSSILAVIESDGLSIFHSDILQIEEEIKTTLGSSENLVIKETNENSYIIFKPLECGISEHDYENMISIIKNTTNTEDIINTLPFLLGRDMITVDEDYSDVSFKTPVVNQPIAINRQQHTAVGNQQNNDEEHKKMLKEFSDKIENLFGNLNDIKLSKEDIVNEVYVKVMETITERMDKLIPVAVPSNDEIPVVVIPETTDDSNADLQPATPVNEVPEEITLEYLLNNNNVTDDISLFELVKLNKDKLTPDELRKSTEFNMYEYIVNSNKIKIDKRTSLLRKNTLI